MSLDSYNKFLVRKTKFGIKSIDRIYSEIMHTDARKNDEMINSINEHLSGDRLDLATYLSKIYKTTETEPFFIREALVQKLKTVARFSCSGDSNSHFYNSIYFKKCVAVNSDIIL